MKKIRKIVSYKGEVNVECPDDYFDLEDLSIVIPKGYKLDLSGLDLFITFTKTGVKMKV